MIIQQMNRKSTKGARMTASKNNARNPEEKDKGLRCIEDLVVESRKRKRRNLQKIQEIASLLQEPKAQPPEPNKFSIDDLKANLENNDPELQLQAVKTVCKILSEGENPPIDEFIGKGIVPILIKLLDETENPNIQFEALSALTNISSGTSDQTNVVISEGAVPKLVALVKSKDFNVAKQAIWVLSNIAGDGPKQRDIVLKHNVVTYLNELVLIQPPIEVPFLRKIAGLMLNLCRHDDPSPPLDNVKQMLPALSILLDNKDVSIISQACWAVYYCCNDSDAKALEVVNSGCVLSLVRNLYSESSAILVPVLRSLASLSVGNDSQIERGFESYILQRLCLLMEHKNSNVVREAAWTISNMSAGCSEEQIQGILASGVLNYVAKVLLGTDDLAICPASFVITNICVDGTCEQILQMIKKNSVIKSFYNLLTSNNTTVVSGVLKGLNSIYRYPKLLSIIRKKTEEFKAIDTIQKLLNSEDRKIKKRANLFLTRHSQQSKKRKRNAV